MPKYKSYQFLSEKYQISTLKNVLIFIKLNILEGINYFGTQKKSTLSVCQKLKLTQLYWFLFESWWSKHSNIYPANVSTTNCDHDFVTEKIKQIIKHQHWRQNQCQHQVLSLTGLHSTFSLLPTLRYKLFDILILSIIKSMYYLITIYHQAQNLAPHNYQDEMKSRRSNDTLTSSNPRLFSSFQNNVQTY